LRIVGNVVVHDNRMLFTNMDRIYLAHLRVQNSPAFNGKRGHRHIDQGHTQPRQSRGSCLQ